MTDNWESATWGDEPQHDNRNSHQKPIYSQSFSRGGRGPRYNNDRRNDAGQKSNFGGNRNRDNDGGNRYRENNGGSDEQKTIQVDSSQVGRIIGRGGSKIKQLEQESGARIAINKDGSDRTDVNISGSTSAIDKVCEMIENLLSEDSFGSRGSNRDGPREDSYDSRGSNRNGPREDSYGSKGFSRDKPRNQRDFNQSRYSDNRNQRFNNYQDADNYDSNTSNYNSNSSGYDSYNKSSSYQNNSNTAAPDDDFEPIDWASVYAESDRKNAERLASLPKIVKNLYVEDPAVKNMSFKEVAEFRLLNMNISVSRVFAEKDEEDVPILNPIKTFEQAFHPYPDILKTIYEQNFTTPSPIQCQAWPIIMKGEDMIGIAQTGTGKTLAFLLPALIHIESQVTPRSERNGPTVLILSPTRELALQIEKEINKYSYRDIKCVCVYGGGNRRDQITWIRRDKPEIIVATPGRLDDLVNGAEVKLDSVSYLVLDEADKMLEMGFECQIRKILIHVRSDRQSIMTSATWPSGVRRLASQYSVNPIQVVVGSLDLTAVHSVSQRIEIIDEDDKREFLMEFLRDMEPDDKVIVFCGKKSVTDDIASNLTLEGVKCQSLHGDREQCDREQALHDLKTGEVHILIATDVAARGIDIADITHIFNFDFPKNIEEYVHRIGRTGRAGRTGQSISLFTRRDWGNAAELIKILEEANQGVPEELVKMAERYEAKKKRDDTDRRGGGGGRGRRGGGGPRGGRDRY